MDALIKYRYTERTVVPQSLPESQTRILGKKNIADSHGVMRRRMLHTSIYRALLPAPFAHLQASVHKTTQNLPLTFEESMGVLPLQLSPCQALERPSEHLESCRWQQAGNGSTHLRVLHMCTIHTSHAAIS